MSRLADPQLSFADFELRSQGLHLNPLLQGILTFLDDHATLVEQVRQDLVRGLKHPNYRVIHGEQVPAEEKVFSIFEPHTDLIKHGKARKPVEFGHKVLRAESAQGLITDYQVLEGNPVDTSQVQASLERHQQIFHCAPDLYAADRGFYRPKNLDECQKAGVNQVSIPQCGGQKTAERAALESSPAFKRGQRSRAGIEGRISVLFRGRGMNRCRAKGRARFEVLVGAAALANNLLRIAQMLREGKPARAKKAA